VERAASLGILGHCSYGSRGRPVSASWATVHVDVSYKPTTPNTATNVTIRFTWSRSIDINDHFLVQITQLRAGAVWFSITQLRAGADRKNLEMDGQNAYHFSFSWEEASRSLSFKAIRQIAPGQEVVFIVPESEGLRLPVKQGGIAAKLDLDLEVRAGSPIWKLDRELEVHVTKARVVRERAQFPAGAGADGNSDSRPKTGGSGSQPDESSRPATVSRPGTAATSMSEVDVAMGGDDDPGMGLIGVEEGAVLDEETKSSHDSARLLSHLGDVLSAKAEVQRLRHAHMLRVRDAVLSSHHKSQRKHEARNPSLAVIANHQVNELDGVYTVNELDGVYTVYDWQLSDEKKALGTMVHRMLDQAVEVQQVLSGESHPSVTDT
ncbi:hypothetical protein T484DRAFT_1809598, partial [Baffinella frigidus]